MTLAAVPSLLDPSLFVPELRSRRKEAALTELAALARAASAVRDPGLLLDLLLARERLGTTALGKGVALPHARSLTVERAALAVARAPRGIDWDAPDGQPVSLVLLTLTPGDWSDEAHHGLLARAAAVARLQRNRQRLLTAASFAAVATVLREVHA